MRRYRELLTAPGVIRLTAANNLARLSVAMLSLSLLVAVTQAHGYAEAGLLMLVYAVTNAAAGPIRGRLADRYPPRVVLLRLLAVHATAAVLVYVALASNASMAVLTPACFLLGASVPPIGPVIRSLWPALVGPDRVTTAFAFDAVLTNATFIAGPVFAGGLLLVLPAHVAFAATGVVKLLGDTLAATSPALPGGRPEARSTNLVGPLASGPVRLLLTLMLLDTFAYGCLEVAAVAAMSGQGSAGVLTGLLALGGVVSGLAYGARRWPGRARTQLLVLTAAGVVVLAAGVGTSGMMILLGLTFAVYGMTNGPVETVKQLLIGDATPENQHVEAFSWAFSVMWLGFGLGTTVAGQLAGDGQTTAPLLAATAAQGTALALTGRVHA